jgi:hypothetical protein
MKIEIRFVKRSFIKRWPRLRLELKNKVCVNDGKHILHLSEKCIKNLMETLEDKSLEISRRKLDDKAT